MHNNNNFDSLRIKFKGVRNFERSVPNLKTYNKRLKLEVVSIFVIICLKKKFDVRPRQTVYREISHELSRYRGVGFGQGWRRPFYQVAGTRRRVNGRERAGASMSFLVCDVLLPVWDISGLMTDRAMPPCAILTPRFASFYFDSRFSSPLFRTTPRATRFFIAFHRDIWSRAVASRVGNFFIGNFSLLVIF